MALLACVACAGATAPLERRGVPAARFTREVEASVTYGIPGRWRWETAWQAPDHYRFTLVTQGDPQHYVFDGERLRSYVGSARVAESASDAAALRSIGRWLALAAGIAGGLGEQAVVELQAAEVPAGAARGVELRFADGARYAIGLDARGRMVSAEGPVDIPGVGAGRMSARFGAFRRVDGREIPFAARYELTGEPFFGERVLRWIPGEATLAPAR